MKEFLERMLRLFRSAPDMAKMGFLASFFVTTEEDFVDAEHVNLDIVRSDEDVAPVVRDLKTGAVTIAEDLYVNKQIKPPVYAIDSPVNIYDLLRRQPGETEYAKVGSWLARLMIVLRNAFGKMVRMIKGSIEVQASQVLQTGTLKLTDDAGKEAYVLDYKPKATHFPDAGIDWNDAGADPISDLEALADVIRDDGLVDVASAIFGRSAWNDFIQNERVKESVKQDNLNLGGIAPRLIGKGGKYMGFIEIGSYRVNLFTYNGRFKPFGASAKEKFIEDANVILLPDMADLDFRLVYGGIPSIGMEAPFSEILPDRVSVDDAIDFRARVYKDERGDTYVGEVKSRPICIPVSIDRFGCLKTRTA